MKGSLLCQRKTLGCLRRVEGWGVYGLGLVRKLKVRYTTIIMGYIGIIENNMATTVMGLYRVQGLGYIILFNGESHGK